VAHFSTVARRTLGYVTAESSRDSARQQQSVTYAAVGASQAPDLMQYPPQGYRPLEMRGRIGHGDERWNYAVDELLTGGVYRGAGMGVRITPVSAGDAELTYHHVEYAASGEPVEAAQVGAGDEVYTASGERHVRPGDIIVVGLEVGRALWLPLPTRVVLLEEEEQRVMYAVGTLPGHPFSGEESFTLEQTADGSVWLTVRSFARPAAWWGWPLLPGLLLARVLIARRFLRALMGAISAPAA
jgi:uncharacterized protein (UPF0548 family)